MTHHCERRAFSLADGRATSHLCHAIPVGATLPFSIGPAGPKSTRPTQREVEALFPILDRYPALPVNYIHALFGEGSLDYLADRLPLLARRPNSYLRRPQAQYGSPSANYRFQCYAKPETTLKNFWHDLGAAMVMASIELGVRADPSLELITFDDILRSARMPAETRTDPNPVAIPVPFTFLPSGKRRTITIRPIGRPSALAGAVNIISAAVSSSTMRPSHCALATSLAPP